MASKRKSRKRSCERKIRYVTESEAKTALYWTNKKGGYSGFMCAYRCKFCGNWHIGHASKTKP